MDIYKLKDKIIEWDGIYIKTKKKYVCFYKRKSGFLYIGPRKEHLNLEFYYRLDYKGKVESKPKPFEFKDPEKKFLLFKDKFRESFNHKFSEKSNLDYIIYCLKQKYDSMK